MKHISIMAHLVAGFPSREGWQEAARALADAGVEILEIQIPFSDPTADGPVITEASEQALRSGFKVRDIGGYIADGLKLGFQEVHVMTYANIVHRWGIEAYLKFMKDAGVTGVIVPDFPLEDDDGFYRTAADIGIDALPVAVSNMADHRLELLNAMEPRRVYAALRQGVTGRATDITADSLAFLSRIRSPYLYAGFGICRSSQVESLRGHVHAAVIGSHITRALTRGEDIYREVRGAVEQCIP